MGPHSSIGGARQISTMRPRRGVEGPLWGPGGGASLRPPGGLQLSSAGTGIKRELSKFVESSYFAAVVVVKVSDRHQSLS